MVFALSIAGGELFQRIVDENFEHTEPTSARYMQQILEGMQYVHKQNIVHLDLKPENIVCVDTTGTQIKIIDFGLASRLGELVGFMEKDTKILWGFSLGTFPLRRSFPVFSVQSSREILADLLREQSVLCRHAVNFVYPE